MQETGSPTKPKIGRVSPGVTLPKSTFLTAGRPGAIRHSILDKIRAGCF
jgi:hypothetical protein